MRQGSESLMGRRGNSEKSWGEESGGEVLEERGISGKKKVELCFQKNSCDAHLHYLMIQCCLCETNKQS